jgi:hypothetical protein
VRFQLIGEDSLPAMDVARFRLDLDTYVARVTEMREAVFGANCGCRVDCFRIADNPPV